MTEEFFEARICLVEAVKGIERRAELTANDIIAIQVLQHNVSNDAQGECGSIQYDRCVGIG